MVTHSIAFIGAGNMARSLIGGLLTGDWPAERIRVSDPDPTQLEILGQQCPGVFITEDNEVCVEKADVVLFAIKPQSLRAAVRRLAQSLSGREILIISIVAGVRTHDLLRWLGAQFAVVRCMPNTPALVSSGATGLYANSLVNTDQRDTAESILRAVGLTLWFDKEPLLDVVTALSGSGPAYFFLIMEAMEQAAVSLGLSKESARLLTLQTAFGASKLALESKEEIATLRQHVTSKGGTTERAVTELEKGQIRELFTQALSVAADHSNELATKFGKE
ncbi:MAG: pyrroline-5-carboxylate reductase [Gammaproteobacteria bacterium]|nr:pyrroline-5-carboxylate reductase [Gammaproteobacteria bacterium]